MANTKSAAKRARQSVARTLRNRSVLSRLRGMHKKVAAGGSDENSIRDLISAIDKSAKRGIVHPNAARRRKARLNKARKAA
ncbi:MAG: 30S ribosomal protein S20 [Verrucomicrobiota bacterium]|nr:30S ribosomal protein S20 [Verrucomicrobiota bacterium]MDQ6940775.1 30S ribosomal protein S20 [Verrucomicrobiota bacterium]